MFQDEPKENADKTGTQASNTQKGKNRKIHTSNYDEKENTQEKYNISLI